MCSISSKSIKIKTMRNKTIRHNKENELKSLLYLTLLFMNSYNLESMLFEVAILILPTLSNVIYFFVHMSPSNSFKYCSKKFDFVLKLC